MQNSNLIPLQAFELDAVAGGVTNLGVLVLKVDGLLGTLNTDVKKVEAALPLPKAVSSLTNDLTYPFL